jgi:hypothetical protein
VIDHHVRRRYRTHCGDERPRYTVTWFNENTPDGTGEQLVALTGLVRGMRLVMLTVLVRGMRLSNVNTIVVSAHRGERGRNAVVVDCPSTHQIPFLKYNALPR